MAEPQKATVITNDAGEILDEMTTEAINMLSQGKRNMVCGEVPQAVNQFQEACRLFAKKFGETANECGEAYLCYGKALLELSRMESGVLGNALDGIEDEEENSSGSDDKSSEDDKVEDPEKCTDVESEDLGTEEEGTEEEGTEEGTEEEGEEVEAETKEGETKEDETKVKEGEVKEGEVKGEVKDGEVKDKKEGETSEKKEKKDDEDDVSNLQLAWEMLELAKVIYRRDSSKENRLKLAEAHLKLGEVGLETEQYDTAIMDFKECLKIQKDTLEPNDRLLAESYYQLGLACTYGTQYDDAVSSYKQASKVIESKIEALYEVIKSNEDHGKGKDIADWDDPVYKANKEINELKDILPDIMAKIDDVLDEQKSSQLATRMVKETVAAELGAAFGFGMEAFGSGTSSSSAAPAKSDDKATTNISHLVRKKRKTDEDDGAKQAKEAKVDGKGDHVKVNGTS